MAPGPVAEVAVVPGSSLRGSLPVALGTAEYGLVAVVGAFHGVASHCRSDSGSGVGTYGRRWWAAPGQRQGETGRRSRVGDLSPLVVLP